MRRRVTLVTLVLMLCFTLSLVYNYMVYAYKPQPTLETLLRERYASELALECIGWGLTTPRYPELLIIGGNPLCVDTRGRLIYEYVRFNVTLPGPGVWVFEDVFYFYTNVRGHRLIEIVVEKPIRRHTVYLVFRRGNTTLFTVNATEIDRYVFMVSPGASYYSVSIIVDSNQRGRDSLRVGVYISFHRDQ